MHIRRLVVLLVVVAGLVRPAYADDPSARQQDVKQQLVTTSTQLTNLDLQMAALERSVADTQSRIAQERTEVRLLARALYAEPDSLVAIVFESPSLSDGLTRIGDLTSAGDRAAATKHALDADLARLQWQRARMQADRDRMQQLKDQLEQQFSKLVAQAAAARVMAPAPTQPLTSPDPASIAAIKQIILDAFAPLGASGQQWALRVAACESGYDPYAVNRASGASGLFQFLPSTWAFTPYAKSSVFDPSANAKAAEWLYSRDGPSQWQCK